MATAIAKFTLMTASTGVCLYAFTEWRSKNSDRRYLVQEKERITKENMKDVARRMASRELFPPEEDD